MAAGALRKMSQDKVALEKRLARLGERGPRIRVDIVRVLVCCSVGTVLPWMAELWAAARLMTVLRVIARVPHV